jgi:hypothetical protein
MQKYSHFGLAFLKSTLIPKGTRPVFYVPRDPARSGSSSAFKGVEEFYAILEQLFATCDFDQNCQDPLKKLLLSLLARKQDLDIRVLAYLKFFDVDTTDSDATNYYMEREWRVLGQMQFALPDVRRIIVPQEYAARLRHDLPEYTGQVTFSS